ncbi:Nif3-like dinuclear metal center hexameric protein [Thermosyntropha sp.]|uniref:Nif3-like dinuclear metal center hexameric protein n=1 Tax=Thermosyntropha sp. TaxID=2740820 RepID=UPI0025EC259B|nr:Nif3-like dinuclear metal center hexameric protein [Thermosyntropha sp.]MBO8159134.1 Nif3-like dinuclear metal center hexameric protein [Thermosyntropha sp.]
MARVKDIVKIMEKHFPLKLSQKWDNCGLLLGSSDKKVKRVLLCLDLDESNLAEALNCRPDLIITHHPLFFKEFKTISYSSSQGRLIRELILSDISVYSAHTNLDAGEKGINHFLAELLELQDIKPLFSEMVEKLYKLIVFVPETHIEEVRKAVNGAGAGYIGKYSDCSFRTKGIGTFKPGEGTNPFIGEKGILEEVQEYRLETIVPESVLSLVIDAMLTAHPYEEVAYDIYLLQNQGKVYSTGRMGELENEITLEDFAKLVKDRLHLESIKVVGDKDKKVKKVAVISGAGMSLAPGIPEDIDVLVTGDVKYHEAKNALLSGLAVIDAGHQETEELFLPYLQKLLADESRILGYEIEYKYILNDKIFWSI